MQIKLSTLSIVLGLVIALLNLFALLKPARFAEAARKFPRSTGVGFFLMILATVWFVWLVKIEPIADFESLKPFLYALFVAVGIGSCVFVRDFLAVRGLAVVLLLLAKMMVDAARWPETHWRWVISGWAYLLVIAGIWLTISPWRMRDLINWSVANEKRIKVASAIRLAFGLLVAFLGFAVF